MTGRIPPPAVFHRGFSFLSGAESLRGYTGQAVISFIDLYEKTKRNFPGVRAVSPEQKLALPYLPHEREWHVILNTGEDRFTETEESGQDAETAMVKSITVPGRTVIVLAG